MAAPPGGGRPASAASNLSRAASLGMSLRIYAGCPPPRHSCAAPGTRRSVKLAPCRAGGDAGLAAATGPREVADYSCIFDARKFILGGNSAAGANSDSRRPPRASTCVVCEGESICSVSTHLGRVRGRVLALARPIGRFRREDRRLAATGLLGHRKAPPTASTTSHDPPRDTLNDDDGSRRRVRAPSQ